jgi:hypothetical protein
LTDEPSKPVFADYCPNDITWAGIVMLGTFIAMKIVVFLDPSRILEWWPLPFGALLGLETLLALLLYLVLALLNYVSAIWLPAVACYIFAEGLSGWTTVSIQYSETISKVLIVLYGIICAIYEEMFSGLMGPVSGSAYIYWEPIVSGIVVLISILIGLLGFLKVRFAYPKLLADYKNAEAEQERRRKAYAAEWERTRPERERREAIERAERERREAAARAERRLREARERAERERREAVKRAELAEKNELRRKLSAGYCPKCGCKSIEKQFTSHECHYLGFTGSNSNCTVCPSGPCVGHTHRYWCHSCDYDHTESVYPPY